MSEKEIDSEKEMDLKTRIELFEEHERHPIVSRVLVKETTFKREVDKFYDLATGPRGEKSVVVESGKEKPQQKEKTPTDLIEILDSFSTEPLDTNKLSYDSVRKDYQRWNNRSRTVKTAIPAVGGLLTGPAGALICLYSATHGSPEIAVSAGIVGAAGVVSLVWAMMYPPKPDGTNHEFEEYTELYATAGQADHFMNKHYRNHFIKKKLATE